MKKILIAVSVFVFLSSNSNAQGLFLGVQGGLNNVWISNANALWSATDSTNPSSHKISSVNNTFRGGIGFQIGYEFNRHIALVTEFNGQFQGYKYQDSTLSKGLLNSEYSSSYIQIPLLIKFMTGRDGSGFFAMFGPSYGMLQAASLSETDPKKNKIVTDLFSKNLIKKQEIGLTTIIGIQFKAANHLMFSFGFRGNFGLASFNNKTTSAYNYSIPKSKNGSVGINLGVGYHF
jgi:opacity protein-like surface antigen